MRIIFLMGPTCVGKTFWAKELAERGTPHGTVSYLSTGGPIRLGVGEESLAQEENPTAPTYAEESVRGRILATIAAANTDTLIIDSAPRNPGQVDWIHERIGPGKPFSGAQVEFWMARCSDSRRLERMQRRAKERPEDASLILARVGKGEDALLQATLDRIQYLYGSVVQPLDLTPEKGDFRQGEGLREMFQDHREFSDSVTGRVGVRLLELREAAAGDAMWPGSPSVEWTKKFLQQARAEIDEAIAVVPEKWWHSTLVDMAHLRVEIIDVWHFLMSAAMAAGMDAEAFTRIYYQKRQVNLERQKNGYRGNLAEAMARDDAHIGSLSATE